MSRRTTIWEDLGIGLLAGATIVLASAIWVLVASERGVMLLNRTAPSERSSPSRDRDDTRGLLTFDVAAQIDEPARAGRG